MKKVMNNILALALMAGCLAGCGNGAAKPAESASPAAAQTTSSEAEEDKTEVNESAKPAEDKKIKVGFVISALNEPIMNAYNDYVKKAMEEQAEKAGYELEYVSVSSDGDVNREYSNVQDMIGSGCQVIILNAIDNVASLAAVKECHANDVGSIFFCREADSSAAGDEVPDATVNMDSYDQGYASTVRMFEYMKEDGIEPKDMIVVMGYENDVNAINRQNGCEDACEEWGVKIATTVSCGQWDPATCLTNLTSALQTYPDSNCLYVPSDSQYSGYSTALQRAGKWHKRGEEGHVYIAGTDVFADGFIAIAEGYQESSTENPVWLNAVKAAECAIDYAEGKELNGEVFKIQGDTVDQDNYNKIDYLWCLEYSDSDLSKYLK
ncbi:sugar ABC transporter substrate-binding protein [Clostridium sp. AM58-1XD]|uniref:sugar ABC transporter substrate-binding protein n=1 Tax=Clostridium sp. AM58-1XD TaxID=2292307 RepID=UPI000E497379|nr:sugar ABC transporter substrate-binding protein [Clostridium sp. AM58-1XD]RGZ01580.1 sugar ABC transporter substrate-binding protein [Clostridium sp. AM58-1XD]